MDSFMLNKIAGGVLSALLVIFGSKTMIEIAQSGHHGPVKAGFTLPAPKEGAAAGAAQAAAPVFSFDKVAAALPKASIENGQATFKKCAACHTPDKGGPNRVGPNLWGVVGSKAGSVAGFAYSEVIKAQSEWTWQKLAAYLNDPRGAMPGNKMVFAGVQDPVELADLLGYLRTLSDSPVALPK